MINVEALPATRDFPPDRMRCRHWMFSQFHKISAQFAFEEYDTPILESEELLSVRDYAFGEQLVRFKDRNENLVMLRPEMTPSLARLILHQVSVTDLPVIMLTHVEGKGTVDAYQVVLSSSDLERQQGIEEGTISVEYGYLGN